MCDVHALDGGDIIIKMTRRELYARLEANKADILADYCADTLNESVFDEPVTPEAAYWVGLLMADGTVHHKTNATTLRLQVDHIKHIEHFRAFLATTSKISIVEAWVKLPNGRRVFSKMASITACSEHIKKRLASFGVRPRKSYCATLGGHLASSVDCWRGLVDGDGWLGDPLNSDGRKRPVIGLTGTRAIAEQFVAFVRTLAPFTGKPYRDHKSWSVAIGGRSAVIVIKALYGHGGSALPVKAALADKLLSTYGVALTSDKRYWMTNRRTTR